MVKAGIFGHLHLLTLSLYSTFKQRLSHIRSSTYDNTEVELKRSVVYKKLVGYRNCYSLCGRKHSNG